MNGWMYYYTAIPAVLGAAAASAPDADFKPKKSRVSRSRLTRKPPAKPKVERKRKAQKLLPPIKIEEFEKVIIPPQPALEAYAEKLTPLAPVEGTFKASLEGCRGTFKGTASNRGYIAASLEGCEMEMTIKAQVYDDAVSLYMGIPDLEPELVDA